MGRNKVDIIILVFLILYSCKEEKGNVVIATTNRRPNIVIIMSDDQGWGDLSSNGNANLNTPHTDSLAINGVSFENFFVQPVCSPTRAEFLTGRHAAKLGVYSTSAGGERFNLGETTIAEIFKAAGYQTAAYGKWHSGMQPPYHPNSRGFDDFYGFTSGHWGNYFSPMLEHNGKIVKGEGFLVDDLTDHGLDFIEKNKEGPFFLYLPYNTPHSPMQVPEAFWARFNNKELKQKYQVADKEDENFTRAALAMVENIDYNVGRITEKLKKLNLEENTLVIYMSDNGPNGWRWNKGMKGKKGATDEGGVRTPFFMQWKGTLQAGKKIPQIGSALDILPTLASLTDIEYITERPIDGKSLAPLLMNHIGDWHERLIFNHWAGETSVRSQKFRLDHKGHLYDMENDHGQTTDVSEKYPQLTDSLNKEKIAWLAELPEQPIIPRPFTLGHPDFLYTQLPARDGIPHGNIKRSNRWPNDSFFTNWKSVNDSITWDVEVLAEGEFEVELYYTMKPKNVGVAVQLSHGNSFLLTRITEAYDPPVKGRENDRSPREESYVKDFKPKVLGNIRLQKGRNRMVLKSPHRDGRGGIDVRLLMFRRL